MANVLNLRRSTDRKTTFSVSPNGKTANVANAFGLLSGKAYSCPGQTAACESVCYAGRLEKVFKGFRVVMENNWNALKDASYSDMRESLMAIIEEFRAESIKRNAELKFRIHHDGDFFNAKYAKAWAYVIGQNSDIQFWAYTRSFVPNANFVKYLVGNDNLSLYLSVDEDNKQYAKAIVNTYPEVKVATLTKTMDEGKVVMLELGYSRPGASCPELTKSIPLISVNGGACAVCKLCPMGKANIRFASDH